MSKKDIDISSLRVGMYICGLDISWLDSPFLLNSKKIKEESEVIKLRKSGAKVITIDLDKSDPESLLLVAPPKAKAPSADSKPRKAPQPSPKQGPISAKDEIREASKIHGQLTKLTESIFNDLNQRFIFLFQVSKIAYIL